MICNDNQCVLETRTGVSIAPSTPDGGRQSHGVNPSIKVTLPSSESSDISINHSHYARQLQLLVPDELKYRQQQLKLTHFDILRQQCGKYGVLYTHLRSQSTSCLSYTCLHTQHLHSLKDTSDLHLILYCRRFTCVFAFALIGAGSGLLCTHSHVMPSLMGTCSERSLAAVSCMTHLSTSLSTLIGSVDEV